MKILSQGLKEEDIKAKKKEFETKAKIPSFSINCSITKDDLLIDLIFDLTTIKSSNINGFLYSILQDLTIINTLCSSNSFRFDRFNDDIISVLALSKNFK